MIARFHEQCCGCVEFYGVCPGKVENKEFTCQAFRLLPTAGVNGATGQPLPQPKQARSVARKAPGTAQEAQKL